MCTTTAGYLLCDLELLVLLLGYARIADVLTACWFNAVLGNETQGFMHAR